MERVDLSVLRVALGLQGKDLADGRAYRLKLGGRLVKAPTADLSTARPRVCINKFQLAGQLQAWYGQYRLH